MGPSVLGMELFEVSKPDLLLPNTCGVGLPLKGLDSPTVNHVGK